MVETTPIQRMEMNRYVRQVRKDWSEYWEKKPDHRYGKDFYAFLGERICTDFYVDRSALRNLPAVETPLPPRPPVIIEP